MNRISIVLPLASLFVALSGYAEGAGPSLYAGVETRPVKSLLPSTAARASHQ